jgi:hypothetical protein
MAKLPGSLVRSLTHALWLRGFPQVKLISDRDRRETQRSARPRRTLCVRANIPSTRPVEVLCAVAQLPHLHPLDDLVSVIGLVGCRAANCRIDLTEEPGSRFSLRKRCNLRLVMWEAKKEFLRFRRLDEWLLGMFLDPLG